VLYEIITNKVLVASLCAWVVVQLMKVLITLVKEKRLHLRYMFGSGSVLSAHSAVVSALATSVVSALATSVAMTQGLSSVAFGITAILALVVMYDATVERQEVGQQTIVLDRIIQELRLRRPMAELEHDLREFIGHTPFQVFAGAAIGIIVAWFWITITT